MRGYRSQSLAVPVDIELEESFWRIGWAEPEELEDIATRLLSEGRDSPAVVDIAAGMPDRYTVGKVFDRALREMGREPSSEGEAGLQVARHVAARIVSGDLSPEDGVAVMTMICLDLATPSADNSGYLDYPEFLTWFYNTGDDISDRGGICPEEWKQEIIEEARKLLDGDCLTDN